MGAEPRARTPSGLPAGRRRYSTWGPSTVRGSLRLPRFAQEDPSDGRDGDSEVVMAGPRARTPSGLPAGRRRYSTWGPWTVRGSLRLPRFAQEDPSDGRDGDSEVVMAGPRARTPSGLPAGRRRYSTWGPWTVRGSLRLPRFAQEDPSDGRGGDSEVVMAGPRARTPSGLPAGRRRYSTWGPSTVRGSLRLPRFAQEDLSDGRGGDSEVVMAGPRARTPSGLPAGRRRYSTLGVLRYSTLGVLRYSTLGAGATPPYATAGRSGSAGFDHALYGTGSFPPVSRREGRCCKIHLPNVAECNQSLTGGNRKLEL